MVKFVNDYWSRDSVEKDTTTLYVFGDNMDGVGMAGQACIRGLPNALGIPTKNSILNREEEFFIDGIHDEAFKKRLNSSLLEIFNWAGDVVISAEIGRGLAKMHETAPKLYAYMLYKLLVVAGEVNFHDDAFYDGHDFVYNRGKI